MSTLINVLFSVLTFRLTVLIYKMLLLCHLSQSLLTDFYTFCFWYIKKKRWWREKAIERDLQWVGCAKGRVFGRINKAGVICFIDFPISSYLILHYRGEMATSDRWLTLFQLLNNNFEALYISWSVEILILCLVEKPLLFGSDKWKI